MWILRQSTATRVPVGPFQDSAGAALPSITVASVDLTLVKRDMSTTNITPAASGSNNDLVHIDDGWYDLELTAGNTDTVGSGRMLFQLSGSLLFHEDFLVLPANVYDALIGSDKLEVDAVQWNGSNVATPDSAGHPKVTIKQGTGAGELGIASGLVDSDVKAWKGTVAATVDTNGYPKVTLKSGTGAGEVSLSSGAVTVGTNSDKTGYSLSSTGLNSIVPADPSAIPVLGTSTIVAWIGYFGAWTVNEVNVTSSSAKLRNSADNADLASHAVSDDGTTFSSAEPT